MNYDVRMELTEGNVNFIFLASAKYTSLSLSRPICFFFLVLLRNLGLGDP